MTLPQVYKLLAAVLPQRRFDAEVVLAVVAYQQQRNYAAYRSHRQRRTARLRQLSELSL